MCRKLVTSGGHVRPVGPAPNSHDISNSLKMSEVLRCKCVAICCSSTRNINWPHLLPKAAWRTCELQDRHSLSRSESTCTCLSPAKATAIPSAMRTAAEPEKTLLIIQVLLHVKNMDLHGTYHMGKCERAQGGNSECTESNHFHNHFKPT